MQVNDNFKLLKQMLSDMQTAPDIYKPTNYWAVYEKRFLPELFKLGLHDFRRRKKSILSSFRATDLKPLLCHIDLYQRRILYNRYTRKIPFWSELLGILNIILNKVLPVKSDFNLGDIDLLHYEFARLYGQTTNAKPIEQLEASTLGNPEHIIEVNGKIYTMDMLNYYVQYAYCNQYTTFEDIKVFVELGSGSGKQIEVIKKLHPNICFLVFDIPPQLYVLEQYLSSVFPNDVISYQETRNIGVIPRLEAGKIYVFGNWKFPLLKDLRIDLFWNAASFQEMEPDVVRNYLTYVNKLADGVFLAESMEGKEIASKKGDHGVLKQTKFQDYKDGLHDFHLLNLSPVVLPVSKRGGYSFLFWKRKNSAQGDDAIKIN